MGLFLPVGYKEYKQLSSINNGPVAILMKTQRKGILREYVFIVHKPRQFSIKMNELKMVQIAFCKENKSAEDCFFRFNPINKKFTLNDECITTDENETYAIRKVPFYDSFTGKY